jgi:hypothetical protein
MRHADWQKRFWAELERQRTLPFVWGERDCVLFAATVADAISDERYVERARAAFVWANAKEAVELIRGGLRQHVETVLGPMMPRASLRMGDIALVLDEHTRESLAVHDGAQVIGAVDPGVQVVPLRYVMGGWHVT